MTEKLSHAELNQIAKRWLLRSQSGKGPGCNIAFVEVGALNDTERADAWGYRWGVDGGSVLVEVKTSRSDFLRDKFKPHRQLGIGGLGDFRYYLSPEGIITLDDLPDGWGLLWVNKRGHVQIVAGHVAVHLSEKYGAGRKLEDVWRHKPNMRVERDLLAYLVSRIKDPDMQIQEQREYRGLNSKLKTEVHELQVEQKENRHKIRRLEWLLEENNIPYEPVKKRNAMT